MTRSGKRHPKFVRLTWILPGPALLVLGYALMAWGLVRSEREVGPNLQSPISGATNALGVGGFILMMVGLPWSGFAGIQLLLRVIWALMEKRSDDTDSCTACGYNLTGNLSGVCPECGTRISGGTEENA